MSGTDELQDLLERLKDEVGPLPDRRAHGGREPVDGAARQEAARKRAERLSRLRRPEPGGEEKSQPSFQGTAWRENGETTLFGMLASLSAVLGGILAGLDYLVLIGTILFSLFSLIMLLALFGYNRKAAGRDPESGGSEERMDILSGKKD